MNRLGHVAGLMGATMTQFIVLFTWTLYPGVKVTPARTYLKHRFQVNISNVWIKMGCSRGLFMSLHYAKDRGGPSNH